MTAGEKEQALAELQAAQAAVTAFDTSTLMHEDSSPDMEAQARFAQLQARLDAAKARAAQFE